MFTATVKLVQRGYAFLNNPMPGGKDIYLELQRGSPPIAKGQKILVIREEERRGRGPRAIEWEPESE